MHRAFFEHFDFDGALLCFDHGGHIAALDRVAGLDPHEGVLGALGAGAEERRAVVGPVALDPEADWVPDAWQQLDTKLAAAPLGAIGKVVLVGRPGGPDFRPSEVARLGYLAGIVATVLVR